MPDEDLNELIKEFVKSYWRLNTDAERKRRLLSERIRGMGEEYTDVVRRAEEEALAYDLEWRGKLYEMIRTGMEGALEAQLKNVEVLVKGISEGIEPLLGAQELLDAIYPRRRRILDRFRR